MDIGVVRHDATDNLPVHYTMRSIRSDTGFIWCCEHMQLYWATARIGFGSMTSTVDICASVNGGGIDFNYCPACGQQINITIEERE